MSSPNDWLQEANPSSLPAIVSSTDLFDGDLFGDELVDIYNAAVGDEGNVGGEPQDIPTILLPEEDKTSAPTESSVDEKYQEPNSGNDVASVDDGLGAFRPSTSFNDLTTLLPEENASKDVETNAPNANADSRRSLGETKKRKTTKTQDASPRKRPCTSKIAVAPSCAPPKQHGNPGKASSETVAGGSLSHKKSEAIAAMKRRSKNITPDPLSREAVNIPTQDVALSKSAPVVPTGRGPQLNKNRAAQDNTGREKNTRQPNSVPSETDFKSVAQAAVSSLIHNVGASSKAEASQNNKDNTGKVDTSTAHIKALTGNNWVAACSGPSPAASVPDGNTEVKSNNRARRQNLTPDERARQNRDRNREHARNTRLRKKAYVEELKRTLTELVAQRDSSELEKRQSVQREVEQREVRFRVLEEFLKLRGRNEPNFARWAAILEECFTFSLPNMKSGSIGGYTQHQAEKVSRGVSEVMEDSNAFSAAIQMIGTKPSSEAVVTLAYHCDRKNFLMDGDTAVLDWSATSIGALLQGAHSELSFRGTIRASFSAASNKLLSASMMFDTSVLNQTDHTSPRILADLRGSPELQTSQVVSHDADAILDSLQMPHLQSACPGELSSSKYKSGPPSVTSSDKGESSSDESVDNIVPKVPSAPLHTEDVKGKKLLQESGNPP